MNHVFQILTSDFKLQEKGRHLHITYIASVFAIFHADETRNIFDFNLNFHVYSWGEVQNKINSTNTESKDHSARGPRSMETDSLF